MIGKIITSPKFALNGLALAILTFALDQWLKHHVVENLGLRNIGDTHPLISFFDFTRTNNYGVSLGMFEATSMEMRWILVLGTSLVALIVFIWLLREKKLGDILPLGLVLGGAMGNIYDRFTYGYVIDYADLHFGEWRPFLIFNLADAAITIGAVIILARALFIREKQANEQEASPDDSI